jgi:type I restriction enzyme S subunit
MPKLSGDKLRNMPLPLPPLPQQRAIAQALSDVDALLGGLDRLITKKRDLKQTAIQQLLTGKTRLPGFSGDGSRKQTDVGRMPKSWQVVSIPEVVIRGSDGIKIGPFGSALKKEYLTEQGFKVYGQENVFANDMTVGDRYIDAGRFAQLRTCEVRPRDFLVSMMGTVGQCLIVPSTIEPGIMDSHLLRIRLDHRLIRSRYLLQLFRSRLVSDQVKRLSVGGIMEGLSSSIVRRIAIPLPEVREQESIATMLTDMDAEIAALQARRDKTRAIKQAMMQELLAGKTRLVKPETVRA